MQILKSRRGILTHYKTAVLPASLLCEKTVKLARKNEDIFLLYVMTTTILKD